MLRPSLSRRQILIRVAPASSKRGGVVVAPPPPRHPHTGCFAPLVVSPVLYILNYFMAYRVYLSDYLPLDIGTTAAYLSTGANQFALKILKLFI